MNIDNLYNEFKFWFLGIIEDDPIPFEIKSLVFFINKNYEIGFSGSEKSQIDFIDYYFYFPLESEYFFSIELYKYIYSLKDKEKASEFLLKKLLSKLNKDDYFKNFQYFYGKLFSKAKKVEN